MVIQITPKINYSSYHFRAILKISSQSAHNLWNNDRIFDWTVSMVITDPDHHENYITNSFHHPGSPHKILLQYVNNILDNVANKPMLLKHL